MLQFILPPWVQEIQEKSLKISDYPKENIELLKLKLQKFKSEKPEVSIIIPAWNEEEGILHTLHSLAETNSTLAMELIIVDNNSTDGTSSLLKKLGINTILEQKQGVGHARTAGLHHAKGKYILTGDCDTLYPKGWIKAMVDGLKLENVYCVHGTYSFLPSNDSPRWQYAIYEFMSSFVIKKKEKTQPFLNVLGFNCGFLREKGIEVNGYEIETQRTFRGSAGVAEQNATEDGMMALRLLNAGGKIGLVDSNEACVWTSDRRIQMDGGLKKALSLRLKKYLIKS